MQLYNTLINDTAAVLEGKKFVRYDYNPNKCWEDNGGGEFILPSESAFELGGSGLGSANFVLFSSSSELIEGDGVYLYGDDIGKLSKDAPFARLVFVRVGLIDKDDEGIYRTLKDIEFSKYHINPKGYMVRMSPGSYREQVRVSKEAMKKGINFEALGNAYIKEYKKSPDVLSVKVVFITDPTVEYKKLTAIAKSANDITGTLTHILEGLPTDCDSCGLKDICDEVEGMKELHFGLKK